MNILAISGSLRAASINTALLRATARLAPPGMRIEQASGLSDLPLFNPDIEASDPAPVAALRARIVAADAVLIASPEYAHGITGVLKNALDWMVGSEAFIAKPIALFNASPRATHAQAALREVLNVMSARLIDAACITVPLHGAQLGEDGIIADARISAALRSALRELQGGCEARAGAGDTP